METSVTITISGVDLQTIRGMMSLVSATPNVDDADLGRQPVGSPTRQIGDWGNERLRFLRINPAIGNLLNNAIEYIRQEVPEANLQQNESTITIVMPGGLLAGIRLLSGGIRFSYQRGGNVSEHWIHSQEDINESLATFLRSIPPYLG